MNPPSQYLPSKPEEFLGKTGRIAQLLIKKAAALQGTDLTAKWLFCGPPGTGKTRLATVLAETLAHHRSAIEQLNGQSLSVERVREWERALAYKPITGERFVRVIDEIDCSSTAAQNELRTYLDRLKHGTIVIATSNKSPRELTEQLQTRFFVYPFEPVQAADFAAFMRDCYGFDYAEALTIAMRNQGCIRSALMDAESAMDAKELN